VTARRALGLPVRPTVVVSASGGPATWAGLAWVRRLAARTDAFTFLVLGGVAPRGTEGAVVATGPVEDVAPYYRAADLAICPIEFGGGTKIKLLEALAAGLPTVAVPHSVRGLLVEHGRELLVAEPAEERLLAALRRLAAEPQLADRLGEAGARFVRRHHDWGDLGRRLAGHLRDLVEQQPGRG
jgi:glycosyltransferase involved in cell wall biosynthesis